MLEGSPAVITTTVSTTVCGGAPAATDEVHCWIESPRSPGLQAVVDRRGAGSAEANVQQSTWYLTTGHVGSLEDAVEAIRHSLERLYVELGLDDERTVVARGLDEAIVGRRRLG